MSVEERAAELNSLAVKIKGSFVRFNSQFKSISSKRIRLKRNIEERKERDVKIKASSSSFGKSVDNVKSKVLSGPSDILGKVLGFASMLLFGVGLANIFKVNKKIDDESDMMKEKSDATGNFITGMISGIKGFMGGFGKLYQKTDGTFDDLDNSLEDAQGELSKFSGETDKLNDFDLKNILTNSKADDDDDDDDESEDEGVDHIFKKPIANSLTSDGKTNKNAIKTQEEFSKEGIEVIRVPEVTGDEKTQIKKFEELLKKTDLTQDTRFRNLSVSKGQTFEYDGQTYKAGDIIIIKETVNVQSAG